MATKQAQNESPDKASVADAPLSAAIAKGPIMREVASEVSHEGAHAEMEHEHDHDHSDDHPHRPTCVAVASGNRALITDDHKRVGVWDIATGSKLRDLGTHGSKASCVAASGDRACSAGFDGTVNVYDLRSYTLARTFRGHLDGTTAPGVEVWVVALSADGRRALSATNGGQILLWDADSGSILKEFRYPDEPVGGLAFVPGDAKSFVSGHGHGTMCLWDVDAPAEPVRQFPHGNSHPVNSVAVTPAGTAVSASFDMTLVVWDLRGGNEVRRLKEHTDLVWRVAASPRGTRIASASEDGTIKVWDPATGALIKSFPLGGKGVMGVAFADERTVVYTGDGSGSDLRVERLA